MEVTGGKDRGRGDVRCVGGGDEPRRVAMRCVGRGDVLGAGSWGGGGGGNVTGGGFDGAIAVLGPLEYLSDGG